jgi:hypothetical protein
VIELAGLGVAARGDEDGNLWQEYFVMSGWMGIWGSAGVWGQVASCLMAHTGWDWSSWLG